MSTAVFCGCRGIRVVQEVILKVASVINNPNFLLLFMVIRYVHGVEAFSVL